MPKIPSLLSLILIVFTFSDVFADPATPLRIGAIFPFSGIQARQGELAKAGLELALHELKGKFNAEVYYEDSRSDTKEAVAAFEKLLALQKVEVVLTVGSPIAVALLPLCNRSQVVLFAMGVASAFSAPDDFGFRLMGTAPSFSERIFSLIKEMKLKRVSLLYVEDDYGTSYMKTLGAKLKESGRLVAEEAYLPGSADYRSVLLKIKNANPDAVILASWALEAGVILRQAKTIGLAPKLFACPGACDNPDIITAAPGATDTLVVIASGSRTSKEREAKLQHLFHEKPTSVVLRFFDAAVVLNEALNECENAGAKRSICLKNSIARIQGVPGSSYPLAFDEYGDIVDQYDLKIIRDGAFVFAGVKEGAVAPE